MTVAAEFKAKIEEMLTEKGLNITAVKHPIPNVHNAWKDEHGNLVIPAADINSGLYSIHDQANGNIFNVGVKKNYSIIQYVEAFSALQDIAKVTDIKLVNGGLWHGGAEAFIQFEIPGLLDVGNGGDQVARRLTAISSHSGQYAFLIALTPYRLFCANQINAIFRDAKDRMKKGIVSMIRMKHTPGARVQIENIGQWMKIVDGKFEGVNENYNRLLDIRVSSEEIVGKVFSEVFKHKKDSEKSKTMVKKQVTEAVSRFNDADGGRIDKNSAWNLYNAIQGTFQHAPLKKSLYHERSVLVGSIAGKSLEAAGSVFDICANVNTDPTLYKVDTDIMNMMDGIRI
jgi:hypothetical protein